MRWLERYQDTVHPTCELACLTSPQPCAAAHIGGSVGTQRSGGGYSIGA